MTYKWMELIHGEKGDRIMGMTRTFTGISSSSKCLAQCGVSSGALYYLELLPSLWRVCAVLMLLWPTCPSFRALSLSRGRNPELWEERRKPSQFSKKTQGLMQTVTVVMEHSRVNLHSGTALLNIATEESLSAGAGVGEHCHLQPERQQKQGHKSQIKEMAVGLQTARALVLYPAQLGNLPPWRGDGLLFVLSFSLQTWHFPSCAWRDYLRFISIEMNLFWWKRVSVLHACFQQPLDSQFSIRKKSG